MNLKEGHIDIVRSWYLAREHWHKKLLQHLAYFGRYHWGAGDVWANLVKIAMSTSVWDRNILQLYCLLGLNWRKIVLKMLLCIYVASEKWYNQVACYLVVPLFIGYILHRYTEAFLVQTIFIQFDLKRQYNCGMFLSNVSYHSK